MWYIKVNLKLLKSFERVKYNQSYRVHTQWFAGITFVPNILYFKRTKIQMLSLHHYHTQLVYEMSFIVHVYLFNLLITEIPHCAPSEEIEARRFSWLPDHTPSGGHCTANFLCDGLKDMN